MELVILKNKILTIEKTVFEITWEHITSTFSKNKYDTIRFVNQYLTSRSDFKNFHIVRCPRSIKPLLSICTYEKTNTNNKGSVAKFFLQTSFRFDLFPRFSQPIINC